MSHKYKIQARRNEILNTLGGRTLTKQEIYTELKASLNPEAVDKMIDRDLSALESDSKVVHNRHDEWEFPTIEIEENTTE